VKAFPAEPAKKKHTARSTSEGFLRLDFITTPGNSGEEFRYILNAQKPYYYAVVACA